MLFEEQVRQVTKSAKSKASTLVKTAHPQGPLVLMISSHIFIPGKFYKISGSINFFEVARMINVSRHNIRHGKKLVLSIIPVIILSIFLCESHFDSIKPIMCLSLFFINIIIIVFVKKTKKN